MVDVGACGYSRFVRHTLDPGESNDRKDSR
jgi:hypothetical protein